MIIVLSNVDEAALLGGNPLISVTVAVIATSKPVYGLISYLISSINDKFIVKFSLLDAPMVIFSSLIQRVIASELLAIE